MKVLFQIAGDERCCVHVIGLTDPEGTEHVVVVIELGQFQHLVQMGFGAVAFLRLEFFDEQILTGKAFTELLPEVIEAAGSSLMAAPVMLCFNDHGALLWR